MKQTEYYLGLDMGTTSVGWAVTDPKYHLLRAKGKDLWGIREFDEALPAVERRTHRIARRRRQREKIRIGLLKEYFADAIEKKDPQFYQRLENSKYRLEHKDIPVRTKNGIFNDEGFSDKEYYALYPTIFHLRKELIHNKKEHDVRLVYLALLHMFKHRGHFLNQSLSGEEDGRGMAEAYAGFCELMSQELELEFPMDISAEELNEILGNSGLTRTQKSEQMKELLKINSKDKTRMAFVKLLCGLKVNAKALFEDWEEDADKKIQISFSEFSYEEKSVDWAEALGEDHFNIIEQAKEIYDLGILSGIMGKFQYLSDARVEEYEKHGEDLKRLKCLYKKYGSKEQYESMFRDETPGSYSAYVNSFLSGKKQRRSFSDRKREHLYKTIKSALKQMPQDDPDVIYVLNELDRESFLPKQMTSSNGVIPYQVHAKEMRRILANAESYLSFLSEKDESGLTVSERIQKLFEFQIPYYVGPLSEASKTGWVIRKEPGQVLPWNIEEKVDMKGTSEEFISKLVRKCSYLNNEQVLPKESLEYESYCVLNEINAIRIDGERIDVSLKQSIYRELFQKGKKVTRKQLVNFLKNNGAIQEEEQVSGIDITLKSALTSYGKFKAIFGDKIQEDRYQKAAEDIIFWSTVYGDSRKFLQQQIEEHYGELLTKEQMKRVMGLKFKDWGRLSREFLELLGCDKATEENMSLIRRLWETNLTMMELIHSEKYTYREALSEKQTKLLKTLSEMTIEDLDGYYFSAPVKRMVWQTVQIIMELEQVLGAPPKKLFIEMAREEGEKVRTIPRKQQLISIFNHIENEAVDWKKEIEAADASGKLQSKKMYLYFRQKGRCMYTGEAIDLDQLFLDNVYDIDHIYPRRFVKDDNLENNLVLVRKTANAHKSDSYPIEETIYRKQKAMWKELHRQGLMSDEKFNRLICRSPLSIEQKAGFIARQLVETRQGTKGIADLMKAILPETNIVFSKASNVSEFRKTREFPKSRVANEFHHAQDAYLNIVVGNVYDVKFTQNPLRYIKEEYTRDPERYHYHLSRMFDWDVVRGNQIAWIGPRKGGDQGTITTVKEVMKKNTPMMTRMCFTGHGGLSDETIYSAAKATKEKYLPMKSKDEKMQDVTVYGGRTSISTAYYTLVEHGKKGKRIRSLEAVPIYLCEAVDKDPATLIAHLTETVGLVDPKIRLNKIKMQSLIKKDGFFYHLSGKTGNQIGLRNAVNLCLRQEWIDYIKQLEKYQSKGRISEKITPEKNQKLYEELTRKHVNGIYAKRANPVGIKLSNRSDVFSKLDCEVQCKVLLEILKLTAIGLGMANLTSLGESANCGKTLMSKNLSNSSECILIHQSVTGLFEKRVDLLTV